MQRSWVQPSVSGVGGWVTVSLYVLIITENLTTKTTQCLKEKVKAPIHLAKALFNQVYFDSFSAQ